MTVSVSSKLGKLMMIRTIPGKIPRILRMAEVKIVSSAKFIINTTRIRVSEVGRLSEARAVPRGTQRFAKRSQVKIFPQSKKSIRSLSKIPMSELKYPLKELYMIPNEVMRVLDEFSYLPMWFTMPIIFASSVALGAVVSLLI